MALAGLSLVAVALLLGAGGAAFWTQAPGDSAVGPAGARVGVASLSPGGDSSTYLTSVERLAENPAESTLTVSNARFLQSIWSFNAGAIVYAQPAVVNGTVYVPTWGGYLEAVNASTGASIYSKFLGVQRGCAGVGTMGIASSPAVAGSTVYVGGAGGKWFAVSAKNGSPIWNVSTGSPAHGFFNWASPLLVGGEEYVGLASICDKPLVPAAVLAINTTTHKIDARFNTTLNGSLGASVWSSPAFDPGQDAVIVTTGNPGHNASSFPYSESVLALQAKSLKLLDSWRVPAAQRVGDGDFGATPTIVTLGNRSLTTALNKDGYLYAWDPGNLSAGPLWSAYVGASGHDIAPASFDGAHLLVGVGSSLQVHQRSFNGSLRSIDPATGATAWILPLPAPVYTAPYTANGLAVVASGRGLYVVDASSGKLLKTLTSPSGSFDNAPLISHGVIFAGSSSGYLYAFGLPASKKVKSGPASEPLLDAAGGSPTSWAIASRWR